MEEETKTEETQEEELTRALSGATTPVTSLRLGFARLSWRKVAELG